MVDGKKDNQSVDLSEFALLPEKLNGNLEEGKSTVQTADGAGEYVLLFFSFDIVNSAQYKTISNLGWATFINGILAAIRKEVIGKIKDAEVWRIFGDEVVFVAKIRDFDSFYEYIEKIYSILINYCDLIENDEIDKLFDTVSVETRDLLKGRGIVSLQATAWIAAVTNRDEIDSKKISSVENIFEVIEDNPGNKFFEFIGIDIDTGFRISDFTRARRLVLSFELASLLSKNNKYLEKMHIITYRKLKGVWNGNSYPIIWYYDELRNVRDGRAITFKESIPFDAKELDDIYEDLTSEKKRFEEYLYNDTLKALTKIEADRCLSKRIETLYQMIASKEQKDCNSLFTNTRLELHCVAVCISKDKKVMIAQRSKRKWYPDRWEFGCAKANYREKIVDTIVADYKEEFGIDIKIITDTSRTDEQPIPLVLYSVPKGAELHKGIVFLAIIEKGEPTCRTEKHSDLRLITEEDLEKYSDADFVPDGKDTIKKAFELFRKREITNE